MQRCAAEPCATCAPAASSACPCFCAPCAQKAPEELAFFCGELLKHGGARAPRLVKAIAGGELPDEVKQELAALLANPPIAEVEPAKPAERKLLPALDRGVALLAKGEAQR